MLFRKLLSIFFIFLKTSAVGLGGGYAMFSIFKDELVDNKKLISDDELFELFTLAQIFPGPIAINFAVFFGNKIAGFIGIIVAVLGIIIPPFVAIVIFADLLLRYRTNKYILSFFKGIRVATIAILIDIAITFIIKRKYNVYIILTIIIFSILFFLINLNSIYVIIICVIIYILLQKFKIMD